MKAIILAAGYGTRLENEIENLKQNNPEKYGQVKDFVEDRAKPMIMIAGKPLVQYAVENMVRAGIEEIYIVTNDRYHKQFEKWKDNHGSKARIKLINDGTNKNEERLGAVNDLVLVLKDENIEDNVLVFAGDNLLKFEIKELIDYFSQKHTSIIVAYKETDKNRLIKSACIEFDEDKVLVGFEEKPKEPKSEWICPSVYIYTSDTIRLIKEMRFDEDKKDLIGNIPLLLYNKIQIHVFSREQKLRFDLGTIDDFERAEEYFKEAE